MTTVEAMLQLEKKKKNKINATKKGKGSLFLSSLIFTHFESVYSFNFIVQSLDILYC